MDVWFHPENASLGNRDRAEFVLGRVIRSGWGDAMEKITIAGNREVLASQDCD